MQGVIPPHIETLLTIQELFPGDHSVITFVESLVFYAYEKRASDIHIDPRQTKTIVRLRIDGLLKDICVIQKELYPEFVSRIKICAKLRTDEHQTPLDGRFRIANNTTFIDVRVSIVPTYHGESIVLRLLVPHHITPSLRSLGFNDKNSETLHTALKKTSGMILVTGPTGSGKTTTLYTLLHTLNTPDIAIVTLEDPIEYSLENIKQIPVNQHSALTFSSGLRSVVRQDPNIIMVGEIRDHETASLATQTALTGHLLLSTLHTNNAATTLPRLIDMRIEPYLIASTVSLIIGQRLARTLCSECKTTDALKDPEKYYVEQHFSHLPPPPSFFHSMGCPHCLMSGFSGRVAFVELLVIDADIQQHILTRAHTSQIEECARAHGMHTMLEDGFSKACAGSTSIFELMRVMHE